MIESNHEQQAWIDREMAETRKFVAEQRMLIAEAQKYEREHRWFPWLQLLTVVASNAVISAIISTIVARLMR